MPQDDAEPRIVYIGDQKTADVAIHVKHVDEEVIIKAHSEVLCRVNYLKIAFRVASSRGWVLLGNISKYNIEEVERIAKNTDIKKAVAAAALGDSNFVVSKELDPVIENYRDSRMIFD
ncbi:hypothetical protein K469DRAFT_687615 [Zopfia rhizophila CBS 207.26]|uniref:Uncharacterized protein n=1 Tax=Zopfia rhizophila CBS 207.26 TaxID=1314779 RepID=A0A6A6E1G3_9PEZI|nr:hypothetical protein K469DRAFT_687615 [Zopfia rhizophila CBS 207.26]